MDFPVFPKKGMLCYQDCGVCGQRSHFEAKAWIGKKVDFATELTVAGKSKCCHCGSEMSGAVILDNGGILELKEEVPV